MLTKQLLCPSSKGRKVGDTVKSEVGLWGGWGAAFTRPKSRCHSLCIRRPVLNVSWQNPHGPPDDLEAGPLCPLPFPGGAHCPGPAAPSSTIKAPPSSLCKVSFPQHSDSGPPPLKRTLVIHGAPGTSRADTPTSTSLTEPHLPHEVPGLGRGHS